MPLKLIPPPKSRGPNYRVRGTYLRVYVDQSTGTDDPRTAEAIRKKLLKDIERGALTNEKPLTFHDAASAFFAAGGSERFTDIILAHFGPRLAARDLTQAMIDIAAVALYPDAQPATRNRQVYAPISAILRHNGIAMGLRRPKGAAGHRHELWLLPEEFERLVVHASATDAQLAAMFILAGYTGMRLGEMIGGAKLADGRTHPGLLWKDISFEDRTALLIRTKNGDPRVAHLPRRVCAALSDIRPDAAAGDRRVFRFTRNQRLNDLAHSVYAKAQVDCGNRPFHVLRHSWATWMVRKGADLVATKAWRSATSARIYTHFIVSEEARKADLLPGADQSLLVRNPCDENVASVKSAA